ncbi:MFS transporter [soil metagenome]
MVLVCGLVAGVGASIALVIGYVAATLREDLGISRGSIGLLVSIYFGVTGAGSFAAGAVADRFGPRAAALGQLALVALAGVVGAAGGTYPTLVVACCIGGFAYALGTVGTNLGIVTVVAPERRSRALSLRTAGVAIVSVPAIFAGPAVAERVGWRPLFVAVAVVAAASMPAVAVVLPSTGRRSEPVLDEEATAADAAVRALPNRLPAGFLWFPVGAFFFVVGIQSQMSWCVPYLSEAVGIDEAAAGVIIAISTALGVALMLAFLRHAEAPVGRRLPLVAALTASCGAWTLAISVGSTLGPIPVFVGAAAITASTLAAVGGMQAAIAEAAPLAVGRATGVTFTGYFLGSLVAPTAFGALVDLQGSYAAAWVAAALAFLISAVAFMRAQRTLGRPTRA